MGNSGEKDLKDFNRKQCESVDELKGALFNDWDEISLETLHNLSKSKINRHLLCF